MIGLFKQKSPANILLLLLFGIGIKLPLFLHPHIVRVSPHDGVLYQAILRYLASPGTSWPAIFSVVSFGLLLLQALQVNRLINRYRMLSRPNYLPGMSYLLVTSLFPEWNYLSAPLLINTILLFIVSALFRTYAQSESRAVIFNTGMAIGLSSFIFFPSISFLLWILLAIAVLRPFRLVEWVLCIVGSLTPFYFYACYLFFTDQWAWNRIWPRFTVNLPAIEPGLWLAGAAFLLLVPFIVGGYYIQENLRKMLIQVRKSWSLLLLFLLAALFIPFINSADDLSNWVIAIVPFAAFHASGYLYATFRIIPVLIFWFSVIFIVASQYYGPWVW